MRASWTSTWVSAICSNAPTRSCGCVQSGSIHSGRKSDIAFNDTQGKRLRFSSRSKQDYPGFRKYMDFVFAYAGTYSLERELVAADVDDIRAGDVFIKGGFPGHAVLVTDVVANPATGRSAFC